MSRCVVLLLIVLSLLTAACSSEVAGTPTPTQTPEQTPAASPTTTPFPTRAPGQPPPMIIDPAKQYTAIIETEKGNLTLQLFAADVPVTVNNFVYLSLEGYYDNTTFYRVIPGFMAQAGDPTATGTGGPGYYIPNEITHHTHVAGTLSMARTYLPDTNGSQFFICYAPKPGLDGQYSVFGQLIEGMDVLESITPRDPQQGPTYEGDKLIRVTIVES